MSSGKKLTITSKETVPSGIALVTKSGQTATQLLNDADTIRQIFGNGVVEQQESWATFLLTPIPKRIQGLDAFDNISASDIKAEVESITGTKLCRAQWTRASQQDHVREGTAIISLKEEDTKRFPGRTRLFGQAVAVQPLRRRTQIAQCDRCHGFHSSKTCARAPKCVNCAKLAHGEHCQSPATCINCHGPHAANAPSCAARPKRNRNGNLVRLTKEQLREARSLGRSAWRQAHEPSKDHDGDTRVEPVPESEQTPPSNE